MSRKPDIPERQRIATSFLPMSACTCPFDCVYRQDGVCDAPRINKGNSDAHCHRTNNRDLLEALRLID